MKILILGGTGMLGHKLYQRLDSVSETWTTVRTSPTSLERYGIFNPARVCVGVEATDFNTIRKAVDAIKPDVVVNCIGVIKQHPLAKDPIASLTINSLLPHRLAKLGSGAGFRFIHVSTDCVFTGAKGSYLETDSSDADDLYGRTKFLGEVSENNALTLRTSIIGRELSTGTGLVEWFLTHREGTVKGFTGAIFTGFTTLELSDVIANVIENYSDLKGLYQVSSDRINKNELLGLVKDAYGREAVRICPDDELRIDRSLDSSRFRETVGYQPPSWPDMIARMASDPLPYDSWR